MSGTLLAFDFGTKSIGVAVGQRITGTARPLPAIKAQDGTPDWNLIERLLKEWQPDEIIVGLPLNMDGTRGGQAEKAQAFGKVLSDAGLDVRYQDERMTTVTAERVLISGSVRREDRKQCVDKLAAAVILEQWLASQSGAAERGMNHGE